MGISGEISLAEGKARSKNLRLEGAWRNNKEASVAGAQPGMGTREKQVSEIRWHHVKTEVGETPAGTFEQKISMILWIFNDFFWLLCGERIGGCQEWEQVAIRRF